MEKAPLIVDLTAANSGDGIVKVGRQLITVIKPGALKLDNSYTDARLANSRLLEQLTQKNPTVDYRVVARASTEQINRVYGDRETTDAIASISQPGLRIDIIPKSAAEYRKNPLTVSLKIKNSGIEKFKEMINTGRGQEFANGEFSDVKFNMNLFGTAQNYAPSKFIVEPVFRPGVPVRLTFGNEPDEVQFSLMEFRMDRSGILEAAATVGGVEAAFAMRVFFNHANGAVNIEITPSLAGKSIRQVQKYTLAKQALWRSGKLEVYDLVQDCVLLDGQMILPEPLKEDLVFGRLVDDVASIAKYFGMDFKWPSKISADDVEVLILLKCLVEERSYGIGARFTAVLTKTEGNANVLENLATDIPICVARSEPLVLFGKEIENYSVAMCMDRVTVHDLENAKEKFTRATIGEEVEVVYEAPGETWIKLWDLKEKRVTSNPVDVRRTAASED